MFMYFEDVDLDWRAHRPGWQCWYEASAVAYHRGRQVDTNLRTEALKKPIFKCGEKRVLA